METIGRCAEPSEERSHQVDALNLCPFVVDGFLELVDHQRESDLRVVDDLLCVSYLFVVTGEKPTLRCS